MGKSSLFIWIFALRRKDNTLAQTIQIRQRIIIYTIFREYTKILLLLRAVLRLIYAISRYNRAGRR